MSNKPFTAFWMSFKEVWIAWHPRRTHRKTTFKGDHQGLLFKKPAGTHETPSQTLKNLSENLISQPFAIHFQPSRAR